jgi:hypothetical protein
MSNVKQFLTVVGLVSVLFVWGKGGAAAVIEDFSSDPVAGARFTQATYNTESSFTWNAGAKNLTVVLDMDSSWAYYMSNEFFPAVSDGVNGYFRADFRIEAIDDQNSALGYFGLTNGTPLNNYGQGLVLRFSSSTGQIKAGSLIAAQGNHDYFGSEFNLDLLTDYQLFGSYDAAARRLTTDVWSGATLIGTSACTLPSDVHFAVSALGFQNEGNLIVDSSVGSITLTVDNISNLPEPSSFALWATGLASLLFIAWRRRKRSQ